MISEIKTGRLDKTRKYGSKAILVCRPTVRIDAVSVFLLGVAEVGTQRLLFVGPVEALCELTAEHSPALVGEELERRPGRAVVDALVQRDRVIGPAGRAELQTDVRQLTHRPHTHTQIELTPRAVVVVVVVTRTTSNHT